MENKLIIKLIIKFENNELTLDQCIDLILKGSETGISLKRLDNKSKNCKVRKIIKLFRLFGIFKNKKSFLKYLEIFPEKKEDFELILMKIEYSEDPELSELKELKFFLTNFHR